MTDYSNGKNILLKRPEPGRPINPVKKVEQPVIQVDANSIADAVIKAISGKLSSSTIISTVTNTTKDDFDNSESLKRLADSMTIGGNKESNLDGLGKVHETKNDKKEIDKTIDILSQLGD